MSLHMKKNCKKWGNLILSTRMENNFFSIKIQVNKFIVF